MWRIRNGEQVRIWGNKWIPTSPNYQVQFPVQGLHHEARVNTLIDLGSGWWNFDLIQAIFYVEEAARICSLVISPLKHDDKLVWTSSKNGCFSVRSAYHLEMNRRVQEKGKSSKTREIPAFWKSI